MQVIGEYLFTIFASLAEAIQLNQFWRLIGHSTIYSANEYEPDDMYSMPLFGNTALKTHAFRKNAWVH